VQGRAFGYLRVSTERQADSGLGLEAQQVSVNACAARLGLSLAGVFTDPGSSGSLAIEDRPVLLEAVGSLKRRDVLIVAKRDRLGRDVIAVAMIERMITRRGARIVSAAGEGTDTDDPSGVLMRRLIDSFGEYERLIIGARTRAALAAKRRRGERISGIIPFGFQLAGDGRRLEPNLDEQPVLRAMRTLHGNGRSLRAIAAELNQNGALTRSGAPWRYEYVRNVLRAPVNVERAPEAISAVVEP
jgi:DNA invertase Pin-like site-specific DNA recombinase